MSFSNLVGELLARNPAAALQRMARVRVNMTLDAALVEQRRKEALAVGVTISDLVSELLADDVLAEKAITKAQRAPVLRGRRKAA